MIIEVVGKEIEKIKGDYESYLNGLNMVGEISYSQYSELYDEGTKQIQKAYELGNKANEWHFVKDGDLPKNNNDGTTYLLYTIYGLGGSPVVAHFAYRDKQELMNVWTGAILTEDKIIAWKEIVLPELKESE